MKEKRRNRSHLILIILLISILIGFVMMLNVSPLKGEALGAINKCENELEIKEVWDVYYPQLQNDDDFVSSVRNKLSSFDLADSSLLWCLDWLPATEPHLNVILVPDLSNRIVNSGNPDLLDRDLGIAMAVWEAFVESASRPGSEDCISVVLLDSDRQKNDAGKCVSNLITDMKHVKRKPDKPYFNSYRKGKFKKNFKALQDLAIQNPIEADFNRFLMVDINDHIRKPTLDKNYRNKLIIITDGYFQGSDTILSNNYLERAVKDGQTGSFLRGNNLLFNTIPIRLINTDVLICEISSKPQDPWYTETVLRELWIERFEAIGCNSQAFGDNISGEQIRNEVKRFILNKD